MKTKKISLKEIQGALSRAEMKQIMAGSGSGGCGTGISCDGKIDGEYCGTKTCTCEFVQHGGNVLYCRSDY